MSAFVIAGVTGHVGSVVAETLLTQGRKMAAIVRDEHRGAPWGERGAQLAIGSLGDREFLTKTLTGAEGFFALLPPNITAEDLHAQQRRMADAITGAVKDSGVPLVLLLSSLGAELAAGTGPIQDLHYLEQALRATGTRLIALRACFFQENVAGILPVAQKAGVFPNLFPSDETAIPMVATRDIGRVAAELLQTLPPASEIVDLLGPEYTARQLSEKLGGALGMPLQLITVPSIAQVPALMQTGLSRSVAEAIVEMHAALASGKIRPAGNRTLFGQTSIDEVLPDLIAGAASTGGHRKTTT